MAQTPVLAVLGVALVAVAVAALTAAVLVTRHLLHQRDALVALRGDVERARARHAEVLGRLEAVEDDALTGLPTGARFTQAVQRGSGAGPALLHVALDGFRGFNGRHGRATGDAVLAEVAQRLRGAVRADDEVGRLGGDEFAVLVHDPAAAVDVAVRLLAVLAEPHAVDVGEHVPVAASIGVAHHVPDGPGLLVAAEQAVADAKAGGGGCVRVWDAAAGLADRTEARGAARLREGLADELEVHYQASVDLDAGLVSGVECLVRWRREGVLVPPDEFVGLAERHDLVAELGRFVLRRAAQEAGALRAAAGHDLVIAVNVSAPQLADPLLLPAVHEAVAALGSQRLVLEMTESVLLAEDGRTQQALDDLVAAGAHLTVDDFGTGCATLAYLRRRPFSAFKIDRSYVRDLETDRRTRDLVEGLVLLAAATGMGLVAEGVETPGQSAILHAMGAPTQQGFLHHRPAPADEAAATISALVRRLAGDQKYQGNGEKSGSRLPRNASRPSAASSVM